MTNPNCEFQDDIRQLMRALSRLQALAADLDLKDFGLMKSSQLALESSYALLRRIGTQENAAIAERKGAPSNVRMES